MAREIYVISDTHFGHKNIIKYCGRPFSDAKEMDEALLHNWNSVVRDQDIVYHLGDVSMGNDGILHSLRGRKRLVLGNHDNGKNQTLLTVFEKIMMWRHFKEFGVVLSHVPIHPGSLNEKIPRNVHGHIHDKTIDDNRYRNVSVEQINYTPINIEELRVR